MSIKELEGLQYTEYINLKVALKIVQNWDKILSSFPPERQEKINNNNYDLLNGLKKIVKEGKEIIYTSYKFSKNLGTFGRLFAQNASLQGLPREIRNALASGLYYDIDMKNAHPTFLSHYCKENGIVCDILNKYIQNRDDILTKICDENNCNKDTAKQAFLSILNGGSSKIESQFINEFKQEIKKIHKQICALNPVEFKKLKTRKDFNAEGSMINIILCKIEHHILMNSVFYMKSLGYKVDVLVFDGFMVRVEPNKEVSRGVLDDLQKYIQDKTGYDIKFEVKPLDNILDLSIYPDNIIDEKQDITYYKDKEEFEKTHLKIIHPAVYLTQLRDGTTDIQGEDKFTGSYKHIKTTVLNEKGQPVKVSFIKTWLNDEHIRNYERMVFIPPPIHYENVYYNTWTDFEIVKHRLPIDFDINKNIYINRYKEFINNLFDHNKEYVDYYDAWCANIIQYPAYRSCVCLVLYSLFEGVGKNMSTRTLELCLGEKYTFYVSDATNQLFGKHSNAEHNRLLVVLNEVKGKDTYSNTDLFKTRITDPKREIELKGKDTFHITNYSSYILNSNNACVVNAGDKDRRFCVLPCMNKKIDDKEYFDAYEKEINNNPEAIRCIYEYLKNYNIEKVVPNRLFASHRPKSDMYKELQECNREKEWDFLEQLIIENEDEETLTIEMSSMWLKYQNFCRTNNYEIAKLSSKRFHYYFSQQVIVLLDNKQEYQGAIVKDRTSLTRNYVIDVQKLKKYFNIEA